MRYVCYATDTFGVALATYELECSDDEEAKFRARPFLEAHPSLEIWEGVRLVARITRPVATQTR
jgi:hypothetical protein